MFLRLPISSPNSELGSEADCVGIGSGEGEGHSCFLLRLRGTAESLLKSSRTIHDSWSKGSDGLSEGQEEKFQPSSPFSV